MRSASKPGRTRISVSDPRTLPCYGAALGRPASIEAIRKLTFQASFDYLEHAAGRYVESRQGQAQLQIEFESSDLVDLTYTDSYEFLDENFRLGGGVTIQPGRYAFRDMEVGFTSGLQRWYSGSGEAR